jgi:hypothetical protein
MANPGRREKRRSKRGTSKGTAGAASAPNPPPIVERYKQAAALTVGIEPGTLAFMRQPASVELSPFEIAAQKGDSCTIIAEAEKEIQRCRAALGRTGIPSWALPAPRPQLSKMSPLEWQPFREWLDSSHLLGLFTEKDAIVARSILDLPIGEIPREKSAKERAGKLLGKWHRARLEAEATPEQLQASTNSEFSVADCALDWAEHCLRWLKRALSTANPTPGQLAGAGVLLATALADLKASMPRHRSASAGRLSLLRGLLSDVRFKLRDPSTTPDLRKLWGDGANLEWQAAREELKISRRRGLRLPPKNNDLILCRKRNGRWARVSSENYRNRLRSEWFGADGA